jgi:hypothetical protein
VQVEQAPQLLIGGLLDGAHLRAAGVVDQDVDPSEALNGGGDRRLALAGVGHVQGEESDVAASLEVAQRVCVSRRGRDTVAALQRGVHQLAPEPTRRPGDQPNPAVRHQAVDTRP